MTINEIFPNPTVKQVIFQIIFPNLFYMEKNIGDLQVKIMEEFPQSSLVLRRQFILADIGPEGKIEKPPPDLDKEAVKKIWQFKSEKDFELNILNDSLGISSQYHKTYNLGDGDKFRDIIEFVLNHFFEVVSIPIIKRIGLRYIDECPILSKDNKTFKSWYNSVFPLDRFNIADADEMTFRTKVKKDSYYLRYAESLKKEKDEYKLILDFDSYAKNINPKDCLDVTDKLHEIILAEYEDKIKEPVYEYMKKPKEE